MSPAAGSDLRPVEYKAQAVRAAPGFNDWAKDEEPEMETEKELSEGQLHPESRVLLWLGTQDCQNSAPARRWCRQHGVDSSGKLLCRLHGRENEEALPGLRATAQGQTFCLLFYYGHCQTYS